MWIFNTIFRIFKTFFFWIFIIHFLWFFSYNFLRHIFGFFENFGEKNCWRTNHWWKNVRKKLQQFFFAVSAIFWSFEWSLIFIINQLFRTSYQKNNSSLHGTVQLLHFPHFYFERRSAPNTRFCLWIIISV